MPVASDHDDLLDIKEAAQFLNVSETSLRRWTNSGRLACVRLGRKRERRFRRADLLAFLEEQPAGAPPVSHVCGLYANDRSRVKLAVDFLAAGFEPGGVSYLAAVPDAHDQIVGDLERCRPSVRADIDAGRLVLVEYPDSQEAQAYCDRWDGLYSAARRAGARALRTVGDSSSTSGSTASWRSDSRSPRCASTTCATLPASTCSTFSSVMTTSSRIRRTAWSARGPGGCCEARCERHFCRPSRSPALVYTTDSHSATFMFSVCRG